MKQIPGGKDMLFKVKVKQQEIDEEMEIEADYTDDAKREATRMLIRKYEIGPNFEIDIIDRRER
jgi:hypothetical protein